MLFLRFARSRGQHWLKLPAASTTVNDNVLYHSLYLSNGELVMVDFFYQSVVLPSRTLARWRYYVWCRERCIGA